MDRVSVATLLVVCWVQVGALPATHVPYDWTPHQPFDADPFEPQFSPDEYCRLSLKHLLCGWRRPPAARSCGQVHHYDDWLLHGRLTMLMLHNYVRQRVVAALMNSDSVTFLPVASNMGEMAWDSELAYIAQAYADQCTREPDCTECRRVSRFDVGQNVFSVTLNTTDAFAFELVVIAVTAFVTWAGQVRNMTDADVDSFGCCNGVDQVSKLLWAETTQLGCGMAVHETGQGMRWIVVCNYGPPGNIVGQPIYKTGAACSNCPEDKECSVSYPGLCSHPASPDYFLTEGGESNLFDTFNENASFLDLIE